MEQDLERQLRELGNMPVPDKILINIQRQLGQLTPEWAARQYQLGKESRASSNGDRRTNLEMAKIHFKNALHVYTPEDYPHEWAIVFDELCSLYQTLIAFYDEALRLAQQADLAPEQVNRFRLAVAQTHQEQQMLILEGSIAGRQASKPHVFVRLFAALSGQLTGIRRLLSMPQWQAIAAGIGLVIIILSSLAWQLSSQTPTYVQAASLSLHQSLMEPRPGATWVHTVSWSPDGKYIAVLWDDNTMQVLDAGTGEKIFSQKVGWGYGLAWSPDSQFLASVGKEDNTIQIWNISTHQCEINTLHQCMIYTEHTALVEAIAWSPDGSYIASASDDQTVQIWDARTMKQVYIYRDRGSKVTAIAWSPDGKRLVLGDDNDNVRAWDALTGAHDVSYVGHKGAITSVSWSPDANSIASSSYDSTVRIWNVKKGTTEFVLPSNGPIFAVVWAPRSSSYLALACYDGSVQVWTITNQGKKKAGTELAAYPKDGEQYNGIFTISWSPQGNHLIAGGRANILTFKLGE